MLSSVTLKLLGYKTFREFRFPIVRISIAFIPIVAESLGGWHKVALEQFRKLGSALARHTGQEEGEKTDHLVKRVSILLQRGLSGMLLNRIPDHPPAEIDGQE